MVTVVVIIFISVKKTIKKLSRKVNDIEKDNSSCRNHDEWIKKKEDL